ncbi:hypothetical protein [Rhizobium sp. LC145]|uniref:hypothetical protein n=1 Tax=Rhizobium sp. LC145 TaxID=1120688 RepID=UPI00062A4358|nr:hypothetical protein [Rhizobium sp. LC145]KKX33912.1 hypothetical protein YH62_01665 [Rhizobium sp. LC145]TKT44279.1 hypothetical protein FDR95_26305 [Rhizobiaceae bacterium LC148]
MINKDVIVRWESGQGEASGELNAMVNGEAFNATTLIGFHISDAENKGRFAIGKWPVPLTGREQQKNAFIQIVINEDLELGNYEVPSKDVSITYGLLSTYDDGSAVGSYYDTQSGTLQFEYNHVADEVKGVFSFVATDEAEPGQATNFDITGTFSNKLLGKKA